MSGRDSQPTASSSNERNPHAAWLRQFAEFIRDAISPSEKQHLQHCADLIDRAAVETPAPPVRGQHCTCAYYREDGFTIESGSPCSIHPNGCEHGRDWKTPCTECHRTLWGEPPPEQVKTTLNQESDRG